MSYSDDGEHHLGYIEGVPPIMVRHVSVILFHAQEPTTENVILDMKTPNQIQIKKHSEASLHQSKNS